MSRFYRNYVSICFVMAIYPEFRLFQSNLKRVGGKRILVLLGSGIMSYSHYHTHPSRNVSRPLPSA